MNETEVVKTSDDSLPMSPQHFETCALITGAGGGGAFRRPLAPGSGSPDRTGPRGHIVPKQ